MFDFTQNMLTVLIPVILIIVLVIILAVGYVKAPPDRAFIISGLKKEPKILIGRAGIRVPFLERLDKLYQDGAVRSHHRLYQCQCGCGSQGAD